MAGGGGGAPPPLPAGGGGAAGGGVAPCKWEIFVKVHSQERFWPKKQFDVKLCEIPGGNLGAAAQTAAIAMAAKDSPEAHFKGNDTHTYGVTAAVGDIADEFEWILAASKTSKSRLAKDYKSVTVRNGNMGKQAKHVDLYIRHPLYFYLNLKFKDPENKVLTFPKDFPVHVYGKKDKKVATGKTDEDGKIKFEIDRKYDWVTFKFGGDKALISNGDSSTAKTELKKWNEMAALATADAKFLSPPSKWSLIESDWAFSEQPKYIDGTAAYKEDEAKIYLFDDPTKNWVKRIGEDNAYVDMVLDPHWQFVRYEMFDRYYGHGGVHSHKRVNIPTLFVESYWGKNGKFDREGGGHWTLNAADRDASVHCVPWIRQKDAAGVKVEKPDVDSMLMFKTKAGTFVNSTDENTRKLEVLKNNDPRLKPNVDRLKLYDLPEVWKSLKYYARYKDGAGDLPGKFYDAWDQAGYLKSRGAGTPMVFSLDDVVLTDEKFHPLALANTDRFAYFHHRFKPDYDKAAQLSREGVYDDDSGNQKSYLSKGLLEGAKFNYLTGYPNWIRMVAGEGWVFDVFNRRTTKEVFGARAAVRWYNVKKNGTAAGKDIGWPGVVDKTYFTAQPYYGQEFHHRYKQFTGPNVTPRRIGRYDMILLRCCDNLGGKELFMTVRLFRLFFNFLATSANNTVALQDTYVDTAAVNLTKRWNGNDAANGTRTELVPRDAAKMLQGENITFVQRVMGLKEAHFTIDIDNMGAGARAGMTSANGTGVVDDNYAAPDGRNATNSYTLAHELGHGASLPDEYGEWWNYCSHWGPGVTCNSPGDAFVDEGRDFDLSQSIYTGKVVLGAFNAKGKFVPGQEPYPMMTMEVEMRNRYFWHDTEFARKFVKEPLYVKYGAFAEYELPGHPKYPKRSYVYWPVRSLISAKRGANGKFDLYLHAHGKEKFTLNNLPKGPFDGSTGVLVRMKMNVDAGFASVTDVRDAIRGAFLSNNGVYYAKGKVKVPTDAGNKTVELAKTRLRFSPRFLIKNVDTGLSAAAQANYPAVFSDINKFTGSHYDLQVIDSSVNAAAKNGFKRGKYGPNIVADSTQPGAVIKAAISAQAKVYAQEMLGIPFNAAGPQAADLKGIAEMIFHSDADVQPL